MYSSHHVDMEYYIDKYMRFAPFARFGALLYWLCIKLPATRLSNINAAPTLAYAGILTVGVAYTLQVIAQADANPSHAAIILSLEAVFGALGGYLILDEWLTPRQMFGCALMLGGMIMSQLAHQDAQSELCKDGDRTHA